MNLVQKKTFHSFTYCKKLVLKAFESTYKLDSIGIKACKNISLLGLLYLPPARRTLRAHLPSTTRRVKAEERSESAGKSGGM